MINVSIELERATENIKKLFESTGMGVDPFEKAIGVSQGTIKNIRNGRNLPSADCLIKVANYFKISLDELLEREIVVKNDYSSISQEEMDLLTIFAEYSHDDQIRIVEQLRCQVKLTKGVDVFGLFSSKETTVATATTSKK